MFEMIHEVCGDSDKFSFNVSMKVAMILFLEKDIWQSDIKDYDKHNR